jgi:predicted nucleotidyltransferase
MSGHSTPERSFGLSSQVINRLRQVLASYPEVDQAILYGSRAMGTFQPASDIDLTLIGAKLTPQLMTQIDAALDDLLLPYMIDLSTLASINHGPLLDHIQRVGVVVYRSGEDGL